MRVIKDKKQAHSPIKEYDFIKEIEPDIVKYDKRTGRLS
ncbi:hypothetical protein HDEF_1129 [Candidatus Hamiltonella defensa 5AT (Acyrthosiphon pisum)]|uniref:Uncharacterized protein n=1 Tax=Hamiltonella defensa subsp. Acyrthosiphon pisum (strain 5AT) TaxID=572265 RepID=C4K5F6_HAMD5|nr:hypothetical protein HDEF_1129 [Candidatus Hamiltonella defensa 5AT (Acyrthosiphon pisum)]